MNAYGRTFHRESNWTGHEAILSRGGDVSTEFYPGSFRAIGSKYKVIGEKFLY